jgi:glycosyltransferase involved in cell wall biosynthesis
MNIGGPARVVNALATGLTPAFSVTIGTGRAPVEEGELIADGVAVTRLPFVRPVVPLTDTRALVLTRRLIATSRPSLVHTHMAKAGMIGRVAALSVRPRPPTIHTYHGHVLQGYFGPTQQRAFLEIERALAKRSDALIAVSPEIRDELLDLGVGRASQYQVIPVGIDLEPYLAATSRQHRLHAAMNVAPNVPVVAVVGRLVPIKDHETLFQAVRTLTRTHLAVIGDGTLRSHLEQRVRELGIASRTRFLGWITDLPEFLADADLVVLSSRNEGTPLALIEAMATGRPVVATNVGGVGHVVEHGVSGLTCAAGDAQALAAAMDTLLDDRALAVRLGNQARHRVTRHFSATMMVAAHRNLYVELLGSHRRQSNLANSRFQNR